MTYMFEFPHFVRIKFNENRYFPKYGLYSYSEGMHVQKIQSGIFNGAPVIFIPGNSGSYKQVRSLASVALRKAIDLNWKIHLDYFTVDLNEEFSAIYGGYLIQQKEFVKQCISVVLNLYKNNLDKKLAQVILIGHSMGGKVAQSLLMDNDVGPKINTIFTLATPMDEPVLNVDSYIDSFYKDIENYMEDKRSLTIVNERNYCENDAIKDGLETDLLQDDKLLISIGGGNRDFMVDESLTHSKFSDIQILTTAIPRVWVSTDHLCITWCLQLILVINRFLFSLISSNNRHRQRNSIDFIQNKTTKLEKAKYYFTNPFTYVHETDNIFQIPENADWFENSRRTFTNYFPYGINKTRIEMIRLPSSSSDSRFTTLSIDALNIEVNDWIFGCSATEVLNIKRFCSKAERLSSFVMELLPSAKGNRYFLTLDLNNVKHDKPNWSHILLYIRPKRTKFKFTIDIFNPIDRFISIKMPSLWYTFYDENHLKETTETGASYYKILLHDLNEIHQVLQFKVKAIDCLTTSEKYVLAKVCIPWTKGCNRYRYLSDNNENSIDVYSSLPKPSDYNASIIVEFHVDLQCKYQISYRNSFGGMCSRIVEKNVHRIPSFTLIILFLILQYQISDQRKIQEKFHFLHPLKSYFTIFVCLTYISMIPSIGVFLISTNKTYSYFINLLTGGFALFLVSTILLIFWFAMIQTSRILRLLLRSTLISIRINKFLRNKKLSSVIAIVLVLLSFISCGGVVLIFACFIYFLLLVEKYETYSKLEQENSFKKQKTFTEQKVIKNLNNKTLNEISKDAIQATTNTPQKNQMNKIDIDLLQNEYKYIKIHMTLFTMLVILCSLSFPATISWIRSLKFSYVLTPDPSLKPTIISLISFIFIWQLPLPMNLNILHPLSCLCHGFIMFCTLYCQESIFKLSPIIGYMFAGINIQR